MMINGIELKVTPSSFTDAMELKGAIVSALKESGIKIDLSGIDLGEENLDKMELGDIGWIVDPILTVATDPNVRKVLFKCSERALFGQDKVNIDFFEIHENRKYYYPIMTEVIKVNIGPFFGLASSLFTSLKGLKEKYLKPK